MGIEFVKYIYMKNIYININTHTHIFWPRRAACGILVPRPGIEHVPSAVKAQSPNHRRAREFPQIYFLHILR